jgi:hypothetical protein
MVDKSSQVNEVRQDEGRKRLCQAVEFGVDGSEERSDWITDMDGEDPRQLFQR